VLQEYELLPLQIRISRESILTREHCAFRQIEEDSTIGRFNAARLQVEDPRRGSDVGAVSGRSIDVKAQKRLRSAVAHLMDEAPVHPSDLAWGIGMLLLADQMLPLKRETLMASAP
jgi:hypothetical protein